MLGDSGRREDRLSRALVFWRQGVAGARKQPSPWGEASLQHSAETWRKSMRGPPPHWDSSIPSPEREPAFGTFLGMSLQRCFTCSGSQYMFTEQLSVPASLFSQDTALSKKQGQTTAVRDRAALKKRCPSSAGIPPETSRNKWMKGGRRPVVVGWNYANEDIIQLNFG